MTLRSQDLDLFLITDYNYSVKDMFVMWVFKATYYFSFITNSLCLYQLTLPFTKKSHHVCTRLFNNAASCPLYTGLTIYRFDCINIYFQVGLFAKKFHLTGLVRDAPKLSLPGKLVFPRSESFISHSQQFILFDSLTCHNR